MKILADLNQHTKKQDKKPTDEFVYSDIGGSNWIVKLHNDPNNKKSKERKQRVLNWKKT